LTTEDRDGGRDVQVAVALLLADPSLVALSPDGLLLARRLGDVVPVVAVLVAAVLVAAVLVAAVLPVAVLVVAVLAVAVLVVAVFGAAVPGVAVLGAEALVRTLRLIVPVALRDRRVCVVAVALGVVGRCVTTAAEREGQVDVPVPLV